MKFLQPTPGDNNVRMNLGCMSAVIVFELVVLAALVGAVVGYQTCLRQFVPFPKG